MAGIPPFAGFFTKLYVLKSAVEYNQIFLVVCALLGSLISSYYYIRVVKILFFEPISLNISIPGFIKRGCFISYFSSTQLFFIEILLSFLCFLLVIESIGNLIFGAPWSFSIVSFIFNDFLSYLSGF
jgi:NADH:ubiquinone oxidoreductase subunit 2 (subunit N)